MKRIFSLILGITVIAIIAGCHSTKATKTEMPTLSVGTGTDSVAAKQKPNNKSVLTNHTFDMQGHRGCRGLMPENTWPAMKKALDIGVTTLEMDVVITKDRKVLVSHDQWFSKDITTLPGGGFIGDREERKYNIFWMTYDETKTFDVGMKPHPRFPQQAKVTAIKPLLSDLLDSVTEYMKTRRRPMPQFNIETKSDPGFDGVFQPAPNEFVDLLMGVVKEKGIQDRTFIQSFDFRTLQYLHKTYPEMKTAMLIELSDKRGVKEQVKALGFTPTIYSPEYHLLDKDVIAGCHRDNMLVIPWTVNDKPTITSLREMGVDGIITDYPNLFFEN